jgi:hypothetical protein
MEEDLRLCTVKPAYETERRFCFEVLSPEKLISVIYIYIMMYGTHPLLEINIE